MKNKIIELLKDKKIYFFFFLVFSLIICFKLVEDRVFHEKEYQINQMQEIFYNGKIDINNYYLSTFESKYDIISGIIVYFNQSQSNVTNSIIHLDVFDSEDEFLGNVDSELNTLPEKGQIILKFEKSLDKMKNKSLKIKISLTSDKKEDKVVLEDNNQLSLLSNDKTNYVKLFYIVASIISISIIIFYILLFYFKIDLYKIYLVFVLLFGISFSVLIPLGTVPDENGHIRTAYHYSNLILGIKDDKNGIYMRETDYIYFKETGLSNDDMIKYYSDYSLKVGNENIIKTDYHSLNVDSYCFTYFPSALGISFGRIMHLNNMQVLMLGRMFNFLVYVAITTLALKIIPAYKAIMFFVSTLPITLQQAASLSYDSITFAISIMLIGLIIKLYYDDHLSKTNIILLIIFSILLFQCKNHAYFPLSLIPLLYVFIKKGYHIIFFDFIKKHIRSVTILFFISIVLIICMLLYIRTMSIPNTSILYWLSHPLFTVNLISNTLYEWFEFYIVTALCGRIGHSELPIHNFIVMSYFALLLLLISSNKQCDQQVPLILRISLIIISFISFFGVLFSMYEWGQYFLPNYPYIYGFVGRYFTPIMIPFLIGAYKHGYIIYDNREKKLIFISMILSYLTILNIFIIHA